MINLRTFFKVHFDTKEISDDNLQKFTNIHIQRLAANNNNGEYTNLLDYTAQAYNSYFGSITDEDTKFAIQQSLTKSMNNIFAQFKKTVSQKEGLIRSIWNVDSPTYQEFFPLGITEYSSATLANVERLMERMVTALQKYESKVGKELVQIFTELRDSFKQSRIAQLTKIGEVKDSKTESKATRDALEVQLVKNVLTLALQFLGDEDKGMSFFDQSFIRDSNKDDDDELPAPPVPPEQ